ncbi:tRNA (adenosine(37)-N6)-threonylcarbamoyltransferase complex ATPase subunit type 1 TsaE [Corynebacterium freneyi]|uniref:tRNA (adenosine(37)-N6)-threonylcarbamoyltransferase complex ATPase subunit type 1 TsaE n=1 Tax=Corynebacterium freneyi TaxID=134034 RepID=UPI001CCBC9F6|nr:tRNA (adenosine(37)-N6)-threonylcarbamoyltransferase complex ATPase subunit type 1 TsaE [Corynebacterium freneyi]MCG7439734.1 tRNA (adenosine(37)-N6)-threonylcarbamoyltransferase complex ATPase subunit type 1 TsaE [Corynebacterium freneyi]UBI02748.1 tRNA (adenosine(37)-N6)-threonylcarbamoyltransferase complex ATPase subunit type 1 TsaE [Corynebacterium freneyi]
MTSRPSTFQESGARTLPTAEDMRAFGEELGATLVAGDLVILDGPLGAGKTTLTQGIAAGMNVRGRVTSPTFTIARHHRSLGGGPDLVHVDAYRLFGEEGPDTGEAGGASSAGGLDALDALDSLDLDTDLESCVVVAEWGAGLVEQLSDSLLLVSIDRSSADDVREVTWRRVS